MFIRSYTVKETANYIYIYIVPLGHSKALMWHALQLKLNFTICTLLHKLFLCLCVDGGIILIWVLQK
jgi:hypothetical protein